MNREQFQPALASNDSAIINTAVSLYLEDGTDQVWTSSEIEGWAEYALGCKHWNAIDGLITAKLLPNHLKKDVLFEAAKQGQTQLVQDLCGSNDKAEKLPLMVEAGTGLTPLLYAVYQNDPIMTRAIALRNGAPDGHELFTALDYAALTKRFHAIFNLLADTGIQKALQTPDTIIAFDRLLEAAISQHSAGLVLNEQLVELFVVRAQLEAGYQLSDGHFIKLLPLINRSDTEDADVLLQHVSLQDRLNTAVGYASQNIFDLAAKWLPSPSELARQSSMPEITDAYRQLFKSAIDAREWSAPLFETLIDVFPSMIQNSTAEQLAVIEASLIDANNYQQMAQLAACSPRWASQFKDRHSHKLSAQVLSVLNCPELILNPDGVLKDINVQNRIDPLLIDFIRLYGRDERLTLPLKDGKTLLHYAAEANNNPLCYFLLSQGGNALKLAENGESPFSLAVKAGADKMLIAQMLHFSGELDKSSHEWHHVYNALKDKPGYVGLLAGRERFAEVGELDFYLKSLQFEEYAVKLNSLKVENPDYNIHSGMDLYGRSALSSAIHSKNLPAVVYLLQNWAFSTEQRQQAYALSMALNFTDAAKFINFEAVVDRQSRQSADRLKVQIQAMDREAHATISGSFLWGYFSSGKQGENFLDRCLRLISEAQNISVAHKKELLGELTNTETYKYCFKNSTWHAAHLGLQAGKITHQSIEQAQSQQLATAKRRFEAEVDKRMLALVSGLQQAKDLSLERTATAIRLPTQPLLHEEATQLTSMQPSAPHIVPSAPFMYEEDELSRVPEVNPEYQAVLEKTQLEEDVIVVGIPVVDDMRQPVVEPDKTALLVPEQLDMPLQDERVPQLTALFQSEQPLEAVSQVRDVVSTQGVNGFEREQLERLEQQQVERMARQIEAEKQRLEAEKQRLETERLEAEKQRLETERLEAEKQRLETERLEAEKQRLETERLEAEKQRLEIERLEAEKQRLETERLEAEKQRLETERLEAERQRNTAQIHTKLSRIKSKPASDSSTAKVTAPLNDDIIGTSTSQMLQVLHPIATLAEDELSQERAIESSKTAVATPKEGVEHMLLDLPSVPTTIPTLSGNNVRRKDKVAEEPPSEHKRVAIAI